MNEAIGKYRRQRHIFISRAKRVQNIFLHKECLEKGDTIAF